ncbi:hypothetical protein CC80DRAFT_553920 [Byssothecium circinans]|uniref:Uncharacterized protein n=1 Tax=Byssothecium circinans TaxID=147558 RepID=A0A6A5TDB3_9PLEO|nr:hypothetical protein CC80DRAFT_553920 [Byssothecium circinans]
MPSIRYPHTPPPTFPPPPATRLIRPENAPTVYSHEHHNPSVVDRAYEYESSLATTEGPQGTITSDYHGRQYRLNQLPLDLAAFSAIRVPDNVVPSSSCTNALALHSYYTDSSTSAQSRKSRSNRATNSAETYSNLQLLNKPVACGVMDVNLVKDIRVLIEDLQALCEGMQRWLALLAL